MIKSPELNGFLSEIVGIVKPWSVSSVELDKNSETVSIELDYDRADRPEPPHCQCGEGCGYYDTVRKSWRHADLCGYLCIIGGDVPRIKCKTCGKVFRISVPWAAESINKYTDRFEAQLIRLAKEMPMSSVCREMSLALPMIMTSFSYVFRVQGNEVSA